MKKFYISLVICLLGITGITNAQTYNWEEQVITDRSESLQSMEISDDGTASIIGYGNTFYQSTDDGQNWKESPLFYNADNFDYGCISFSGKLGFAGGSSYFKVVDRKTSLDIYANSPLLKTTDGGESWELMTVDSIGSNEEDDALNLGAIGNFGAKFDAVNVINDSVVYLSASWYDVNGTKAANKHSNVFKSTNAGLNWYPILPDNTGKSIASIQEYNGNIYIAGYKTLYKVNITTDEATNLYSTVTALNKKDNNKMFFVKTTIYNNELIFPTYKDSIWITNDEGATFSTLPGGLTKGYYVYKYDNNHIIVAAGKDDTKATSDGGTTWTSISTGESLWNCGVTKDSLIALGTQKTFSMSISDIAAGNYSWSENEISDTKAYLKGIDTVGSTIFISGYADQILKSTDNGATYTAVTLPSKSDMVYASVDLELRGYGQGKDGAAILSSRRYKLADYPYTDSRNDSYIPGIILATQDNWATSFAIDDSKIGEKYGDDVSKNPYAEGCCYQDFYSAECIDTNTVYIFASWYDTTGVDYEKKTTYSRIFKTTNAAYAKDNKGAAEWDTITANLGKKYIKTINFKGDTGYIAGGETLLKTTDGGATLTSLVDKLTDLGATTPYVQNAIFNGDTLYVPTTNDGVFVSYDAGNTFSLINEVTNASDFVVVDANSWMTLGSSQYCFYTNDAGANWESCAPASTVYRAGGIYADNIIALCKSKIYKLPVSDLNAGNNTAIDDLPVNTESDISLTQYSSEIAITADDDIKACYMYNMAGQKVLSAMPSSTSYSFNTTSYKNGVYIIKVIAGDKFETYKVVLH